MTLLAASLSMGSKVFSRSGVLLGVAGDASCLSRSGGDAGWTLGDVFPEARSRTKEACFARVRIAVGDDGWILYTQRLKFWLGYR